MPARPKAPAETPALEPITDPIASARAAGLRYVTDTKPGIRRTPWRKSFRYTSPDGTPLKDPETLARIKSLVIPPAWQQVWICPHPNGHLQATGRDARGRKQSRYHPRWRETRDETKYSRMILFGQALPAIRARVEHDLALPGLPREKVLATLVRLLQTTFIRVGNPEYARENKSFGLTTMRRRHVRFAPGALTFDFQGKSGVHHTIDVHDRRLIKIVQRIADIPGFELFQYLDPEGNRHSIDSADVNQYLHDITGEHFTAKDFRTWAGTVLAARMLAECEPYTSESQAKKNVVEAIKSVAGQLGNTPSVCRKCYVHPAVLESYFNGSMGRAVAEHLEDHADDEGAEQIANPTPALLAEELALMRLLEQHLATTHP